MQCGCILLLISPRWQHPIEKRRHHATYRMNDNHTVAGMPAPVLVKHTMDGMAAPVKLVTLPWLGGRHQTPHINQYSCRPNPSPLLHLPPPLLEPQPPPPLPTPPHRYTMPSSAFASQSSRQPANLAGSPWYKPICGSLKMRDSDGAVP